MVPDGGNSMRSRNQSHAETACLELEGGYRLVCRSVFVQGQAATATGGFDAAQPQSPSVASARPAGRLSRQ